MDDATPLYWGIHEQLPLEGDPFALGHGNLRTIIRKTRCFIDAETHATLNKPSGRIVAKPDK